MKDEGREGAPRTRIPPDSRSQLSLFQLSRLYPGQASLPTDAIWPFPLPVNRTL